MEKSILDKISAELLRNKKTICRVSADCTKTPIKYHFQDLEYLIKFLNSLPKQIELSQKYILKPKGTVVIGLSKNEPIITSIVPVISAIYANNKVIVKPSRANLKITSLLIKILIDSGIKRERIKLEYRNKKEIKKLISRADFVFWMGSYKVCRKISLICAKLGKKLYFEAEGNDIAIIDNTMKKSYKVARMLVKEISHHNGERCQAVKGIYLHKDISKDFKLNFYKEIELLNIGNYLNSNTELSLGCEFKITKFSLNPVFGASVWIEEYSSDLALIKALQKNGYFLSLSIFSKKPYAKIFKNLIRKVSFSRININKDPGYIRPDESWGGIKKSGMFGPEGWVNKFSDRNYINR
ncbi:MAG: aldehyde dehydrogenase family protein [Candidatus Micrarchaeota archaeon]|nr:aldehyde dehydrogenase family protein [Candidatus Micrarchaeota archaeon]